MNVLLLIFAAIALASVQMLAGGRQLILSLPSFGLLAIAAWLSWLRARRSRVANRVTLNLAVTAIFFGYVLVRALLSPDGYLARQDLFTALGALILYFLVALNLTSAKLRAFFVGFILTLAVANCVIGVIQFSKGENFMPFEFLTRADYGTRASGFFGYPNHLAGFLEVTLFMGLGVTFWSRWPIWGKILAGYASLVCIVGIILTGSRGGYLATGMGFLAFGCLSLLVMSKHLREHLGILLAVIGASILLLGFTVKHFVSENYALHQRATTVVTMEDIRFQLWQAAIHQFKLSPVTGTGSGTYRYYGREFRDPRVQADPIHAHNDYLELLAEYGIIGAATFLLFLAVHIRSGWKAYSEMISSYPGFGGGPRSNSMALTIGALSSIAAFGAHSLVEFNLHIPANALLLAFVFGVLADPVSPLEFSSRSPGEARHPLSPHIRLVLPLLGLWVAFGALPTLPAEYYGEKARALLSDGNYLVEHEIAESAERFARRGLAYDPENPELYYYLGEARVALAEMAASPERRERFFAESIAAYRKARDLAPMDVRLLLCQSTSLDALGRFAEADVLLARAMELDPKSHIVRWAYARHLHIQQKYAEAEAEYQKALALGSAAARYQLERMAEELKAKQSGTPTPAAP